MAFNWLSRFFGKREPVTPRPGVLVYCASAVGYRDPHYGKGGVIHRKLEEMIGCRIDFAGYGGNLRPAWGDWSQSNLNDLGGFLTDEHFLRASQYEDDGSMNSKVAAFINAAKLADVVILDAWAGPTIGYVERREPYIRMAKFAAAVRYHNPEAKVFAILMEGKKTVEVHQFAEPIVDWSSPEVVDAVQSAIPK